MLCFPIQLGVEPLIGPEWVIALRSLGVIHLKLAYTCPGYPLDTVSRSCSPPAGLLSEGPRLSLVARALRFPLVGLIQGGAPLFCGLNVSCACPVLA